MMAEFDVEGQRRELREITYMLLDVFVEIWPRHHPYKAQECSPLDRHVSFMGFNIHLKVISSGHYISSFRLN